jgi:hypothetical protein
VDAEDEPRLELRPLVEVPFAGSEVRDLRKHRQRDPAASGGNSGTAPRRGSRARPRPPRRRSLRALRARGGTPA